uniref:hypothetical protein n=1 Tax=uncultured Dysgonomonas sp. TaxID=206096 RepID=UPI00259036D6|nr:hypothetical protein [uncultured Dysgonomonas sp.]
MNDKLTKILSSVAKEDGEIKLVELFKDMVSIFKSDSSSYTRVVKSALVNYSSLKKSDSTKNIEYFEENGILLFDGMHAAAGGHMSYIYKAKGIRLYLFDNDSIGFFSVYCTMDENGFQYILPEDGCYITFIDKITEQDIKMYLSMLDNLEFRDFSQVSNTLRLLYFLTNVKHSYKIAFYLEYVLYPPDVDVLSSFSKLIRNKIWDICLGESFEDSYGIDVQKHLINELSHIEISPSPNQLTDYYKRHFKQQTILDRLEELNKPFQIIEEKIDNVTNNVDNVLDEVKDSEIRNAIRHEELQKEDIIDFKPNFWGFSINFNEIFRRIRKKI